MLKQIKQQVKYHVNEFRAQKAEFNRKWKKSFPFTTPSSPPKIHKFPSWCEQGNFQMVVAVVVAVVCLLLLYLNYRKYLLTNKALRS